MQQTCRLPHKEDLRFASNTGQRWEKIRTLLSRCIDEVAAIIESERVLTEARLAQRLGYGYFGAHAVNFVWRAHPQLYRIMREYQAVMSGKREREIRKRVSQRSKKRRKSSSVKLDETTIINTAVSLYEQGKRVGTVSLAHELGTTKHHIWEYLYLRNELKEEIGYILHLKKS